MLVACLSAAQRTDEAKTLLATITAQCAELGSVRYLLDGGPHVVAVLAALRADRRAGRWRLEWPDVPEVFLTLLVNAEAAQAM